MPVSGIRLKYRSISSVMLPSVVRHTGAETSLCDRRTMLTLSPSVSFTKSRVGFTCSSRFSRSAFSSSVSMPRSPVTMLQNFFSACWPSCSTMYSSTSSVMHRISKPFERTSSAWGSRSIFETESPTA